MGGLGCGVVTVAGAGLHSIRSASEFTPLTSADWRRVGTFASAAITSSRSDAASACARQLCPAAATLAILSAWAAQVRASSRGIPRGSAAGRRAELPQPPARSTTRAPAEAILNNTAPGLPAIRSDVAWQFPSGIVNLLLMPMLHGCAFPGCSTFTLSTYCVEHELLVRAVKESERTHTLPLDEQVADAALSADPAGDAQQAPAAL